MSSAHASALDSAHAAMLAAPDDDTLRLRFYETFADTRLVVLLDDTAGPDGDTASLRVFPLEEGPSALAFDSEERLAEFAGKAVRCATLPGRVLARLLAETGLGLGLNLEVAPSAILLPASAMVWLAEVLASESPRPGAAPAQLVPPADLAPDLLAALDRKLARMGGLAQAAFLAGARDAEGQARLLLVFVNADERAQDALARAVAEAVQFSGSEAADLDVGFATDGDALLARVARVGLRFDLPQPASPQPPERAAPGSDPLRPPILR